MAGVNAEEHLQTAVDKIKHKNDMTVNAVKLLKDKLSLKNIPKRMECYDISNISGVDKVGSMVVFINGEPDFDSYRRFKIKTVDGANDFKSHQEMMERRLERLKTDPDKFPKPDLIIIDGGKGQLSSVKEIFDKFGVTDIDLISLAEREGEIFLVGKSDPIVLERRDYCLKMLIRIRDEAHRFAITYHRALRGKRALSSVLDNIKGLGKVRKKALIDKFKDLTGIITATENEIKEVDGIGQKQAKLIIDALTKEGLK
jgi:excinuclease ABC subunit C